MKIQTLFSTTAAAAVLACTAGAQQLFGPWVHNTSVPTSLFASPTGSPGNTGLTPSSPWDLATAISKADSRFASNWASTGKGVTINLLPGTYTLSQPLSLPTFGFSIEPYFGSSVGTVTITGTASSLFFFDHLIGPSTLSTVGNVTGMPASTVRGLTFSLNSSGAGVEIDPSNGTSGLSSGPIEVNVNQCKFAACATGVRIRNSAAAHIEYRNVIVDNEMGGCSIGIDAINSWFESDLIRSNRITGADNWMRFDGSFGSAGMLHPRILSNMVSNGAANVSEGLFLKDCSARIVNNSMAVVRNGSAGSVPATIHIISSVAGGTGETIVIANNILFSPVYILAGTVTVDPPEILVTGGFAGTLTIQSNDFDGSGSGTLITPVVAVGPGNVALTSSPFVNITGPMDLHMSAAPPTLSNFGNMAFVVPGATATITLNGATVPANCALDSDLDARTHMHSSTLTELIDRGADEFIETGARLLTATSGPNLQADFFGNVQVAAGTTDAVVDLQLNLPVGSSFSIVLGAALPMGPELQHTDVVPFGSIAIDTAPGNGVTMVTGVTTVNPQPIALHLGSVTPALNEAEMYLQALVALPNGVIAPTNRLRLDIDDL